MSLEIVTVPCLSDNYAYVLHNATTGETAVVDVPDAAPLKQVLNDRGWTLTDILITHHHYDHIDGVEDLRGPGVRVIGAAADAHRLPPLDEAIEQGSDLIVCGESVQVFDTPGHTIGHVSFYFHDTGAAFTADTLMAMGCGRLFEGTPDMMWASLSALMALPPETTICSGHEYTASNARFALTIEPENPDLISRVQQITQARADNRPTVPSKLADEIATNPFLRANVPEIKAALGMEHAEDVAVFAEIRRRKDNF